jgi:hypothetical protein
MTFNLLVFNEKLDDFVFTDEPDFLEHALRCDIVNVASANRRLLVFFAQFFHVQHNLVSIICIEGVKIITAQAFTLTIW